MADAQHASGPADPPARWDDVQAAVLAGPLRYTADDVAAVSRLTMEQVRSLWRAMGFADVGDARAFSDADVAAVLRVAELIERGLMDFDTAVEITRSLGQTTSRLADWQVDVVGRRLVDNRLIDVSAGVGEEAMDQVAVRVAELLPEFQELLSYVWRRQLVATLGRVLAELETERGDIATGTATVGFADLVSFTRLSRQMDEQALSALVHHFETTAADLVHAVGARMVKTLGDEVMFVAESPVAAAEIGLRLHGLFDAREDVPQLRSGLATGVVLTRMGDVYGTTVNRASRFTAAARPGTTLVDAATADALAASGGNRYLTRALAPRPLRGLGIIRPYALSRRERGAEERALPGPQVPRA